MYFEQMRPNLRARRWANFDTLTLGTVARRSPVLRAVLRNVAPLGLEPARTQEPLAVDAWGGSA